MCRRVAENPLKVNLIAFFRGLRHLGFHAGTKELTLTMRAMDIVRTWDRCTLHDVIQTIVVKRYDQQRVFDWAFSQFFVLLGGGRGPMANQTYLGNILKHRERKREGASVSWIRATQSPGDDWRGNAVDVPIPSGTNAMEALQRASLDELVPGDVELLHRHTIKMAPRWKRRRSFKRVALLGDRIDLSATLRRGYVVGEVVRLWYQKPNRPQRPVVVIVDLSGSVMRFTTPSLSFFHALIQKGFPIEVFVFSTRLTRLTLSLSRHYLHAALAEVARIVPDFNGGTRLSQAMESFRTVWAPMLLGRGADLVLITDGLDTGEMEAWQGTLARLQKRAHRLEWWNPLMQFGYRPEARAARVLLQHVDVMVPASNWDDLMKAWTGRGPLTRSL